MIPLFEPAPALGPCVLISKQGFLAACRPWDPLFSPSPIAGSQAPTLPLPPYGHVIPFQQGWDPPTARAHSHT